MQFEETRLKRLDLSFFFEPGKLFPTTTRIGWSKLTTNELTIELEIHSTQ
jgi:hypothetical protein